jgi:hypothetical protein
MKLRAFLLLLIVPLAFAVPALAQDEVLISFTGYDYQTDPGAPNGVYLATGDSYYAVGFATSFHPTWLQPYVDTSTHEYTFYQHGLVVSSYSFSGGILVVGFAPGGHVEYYEDGSFDATNPPNPPNCPRYGAFPPNADAPSKFNNGLAAITGALDNASLYYDYNPGSNQGGFQANMNIDGGAYASYVPAASWNGWFMSGLIVPPPGGNPCPAPLGYDHQIAGECRHPVVANTHGTWGSIKKLYR